MSAKTFTGLMFILLVFTIWLLVLTDPSQQQAQKQENPAGTTDENTQAQATDGMIWESVSSHLLSAVQ